MAMASAPFGSSENDGGSGVWIVVNGSPALSAGSSDVRSSVNWLGRDERRVELADRASASELA